MVCSVQYSPKIVSSLMILLDRIDEGHASLVKAFETSTGKDKDRCIVTKDLAISSVTTL